MIRLLYLSLCLFFSLAGQANEKMPLLDSTQMSAIRNAAEEGDANCQLILGLIWELGAETYLDLKKATEWYWLSAKQGNARAERRLMLLMENIQQHVQLGCRHGHENDESNHCSNKEFEEESIKCISDRPDPADANERVYGPGTGDWNTGILKSDYEKMEKAHTELMAKLNELKIQTESKKLDSIKEQIEKLDHKSKELCQEAWNELVRAVLEAMGAGISIEVPVFSLLTAYQSVQDFKRAAEHYYQSIDVEKEVRDLLKMEKSLERDRERNGRER